MDHVTLVRQCRYQIYPHSKATTATIGVADTVIQLLFQGMCCFSSSTFGVAHTVIQSPTELGVFRYYYIGKSQEERREHLHGVLRAGGAAADRSWAPTAVVFGQPLCCSGIRLLYSLSPTTINEAKQRAQKISFDTPFMEHASKV